MALDTILYATDERAGPRQGWRKAGEWLFLMPRARPQSQANELTVHKTRQPWPRLPEGTEDTGRCWWEHWEAAGLLRVSMTRVLCNTITYLFVFTWTIQALLEVVSPHSALPAAAFQGTREAVLGWLQGPQCS